MLGAELKKRRWGERVGKGDGRVTGGYTIDQAQAAQAQYDSFINTCGLILRNPQKAVEIKDLYGNSGNRFKSINTR